MKIVEDAFSSDIFRQVLLPGIVLSIGIHPVISEILTPLVHKVYGVGPTTLILGEIIVFGLVISSTIQFIYYVYEGFQLQWLTMPAGALNRWRLRRQKQRVRDIQGDRDFDHLSASEQSKVTKIYDYLYNFPLVKQPDGSFDYWAERPTRLGNIIALYELYADSRYGVDGVDFWHHFLTLAPEASRKSFDEKYAFAESTVLTSFAGAMVAAIQVLVLIGLEIGKLFPSLVVVHLTTGFKTSLWLLLFGVAVWLLFYAASLPAHREAGAALRAIIDSVFPAFVEWAESMSFSETTISNIQKLQNYLKHLD
jgi:hypothetical protein